MEFVRLMRHLLLPDWWAMRDIPAASRLAVEAAIVRSEKLHRGELRFVAEAGLPVDSLWCGQSTHERAVELFSQLKVWDTEHNSGVLIYLQLVDRRVEIVADRGIDGKVGAAFWATVCGEMETAFRAGHFEAGVIAAIDSITQELARHFPADANNPDELPNTVVVL